MSKRKTKFSVNQTVAFRYGDKKMIGSVTLIKPVGKQYVYNVVGENGTEYEDLGVDTTVNTCIDTYLTKLFYKKYDIPMDYIPVMDNVKGASGIYLPEPISAEEEPESTEINIQDYSVNYDEENPDSE